MKGQLSAEMLIMIVVIMAIVAIAAVQLIGSAKETSASIGSQTSKISDMATDAVNAETGGFCVTDDDCKSGLSCEDSRCG